jgi:hypothetical protein
MPDQLPAVKAKQKPHKLPVHVPALDTNSTSTSKLDPIVSLTQTFSSEQLIHLQRTVGNKAVGEILRRQKAAEPKAAIQRELGDDDDIDWDNIGGRERSSGEAIGTRPRSDAPDEWQEIGGRGRSGDVDPIQGRARSSELAPITGRGRSGDVEPWQESGGRARSDGADEWQEISGRGRSGGADEWQEIGGRGRSGDVDSWQESGGRARSSGPAPLPEALAPKPTPPVSEPEATPVPTVKSESAPESASEPTTAPEADSEPIDKAELDNPVLALKSYREAVGVRLRQSKRHKGKIERYKTFLEADFAFVKTNVATLRKQKAAIDEEANSEKPDPSKLDKLHTIFNQQRDTTIKEDVDTAERDATGRLSKAYTASTLVGTELPIVAYAYDTLVKMRHDDLEGTKHGRLFGSGNSYARVAFYEAELAKAELMKASGTPADKLAAHKASIKFTAQIQKHKARIAVIEKARKELVQAQMLREQARLKEVEMGKARLELKTMRKHVKGVLGRGVGSYEHYKGKGITAIASVVSSTATLGIIEYEQAQTDGGYSSRRERISMLKTWKRDWSALKAVWAARPYGKMTALHLIFQGLGSLILKPLRKVFTAASLIFAGLSLIPGVAVVTGPLAAFCTAVTLGLVAAKVAVDALLATWSSLTLALNKNAHNTDLLRGQAVGQATDVASGLAAGATFFAGPLASNAVGGNYVNPLQNVTGHGADIMSYGVGTGAASAATGDLFGVQVGIVAAGVIGEKVPGVLAELEGLGDGAKALFMSRQEEIRKLNLSPMEINKEITKAKLVALRVGESYLRDEIKTLTGKPVKLKEKQALLAKNLQNQTMARLEMEASVRAGSEAAALKKASQTPATPTSGSSVTPSSSSAPTPEVAPTPTPMSAPTPVPSGGSAEADRIVREASTKALAAKAKSQIGTIVSPLSEAQSKSAELATGADSAASSVASATVEQGKQEVDEANAVTAKTQLGEAQASVAEMVAIVAEGSAAIDEAQAPAPVSS